MVPVVNEPMMGTFFHVTKQTSGNHLWDRKNIAECGDWFIGGFVDATFSGSFKTVSYI